MATVTKKDLADLVASEIGLARTDVKKVIGSLLRHIKEQIEAGNRIEMRDFGVFEVKIRKSRIGRNPKRPQDVVTIPERKVVQFKMGRDFRKRMGIA